MRNAVAVFIATTLIAGTAAAHFWRQLQNERQPIVHLVQSAPPAGMTVSANSCTGSPADVLGQLMPNFFGGYYQAGVRQAMTRNHPGVVEELGLTQAEADALSSLLQKYQSVQSTVRGYAGSDDLIRQEMERARTEIPKMQNAEIQALLGPDRYQQWQESQPTFEGRRQVSLLLGNLPASTPTLTEEQARSLTTSMIAEQKRLAADTAAPRPILADVRAQLEQEERDLRSREESDARILEAARSQLTALQWSAVNESMTRSARSLRATLQARRARLDGTGGK